MSYWFMKSSSWLEKVAIRREYYAELPDTVCPPSKTSTTDCSMASRLPASPETECHRPGNKFHRLLQPLVCTWCRNPAQGHSEPRLQQGHPILSYLRSAQATSKSLTLHNASNSQAKCPARNTKVSASSPYETRRTYLKDHHWNLSKRLRKTWKISLILASTPWVTGPLQCLTTPLPFPSWSSNL